MRDTKRIDTIVLDSARENANTAAKPKKSVSESRTSASATPVKTDAKGIKPKKSMSDGGLYTGKEWPEKMDLYPVAESGGSHNQREHRVSLQ